MSVCLINCKYIVHQDISRPYSLFACLNIILSDHLSGFSNISVTSQPRIKTIDVGSFLDLRGKIAIRLEGPRQYNYCIVACLSVLSFFLFV